MLYNGANGKRYGTVRFGTTANSVFTDPDTGITYSVFEYSNPDDIENGNTNGNQPDGIALVDPNDQVVEFLSYEGRFTAANGPANGVTSTNIGFSENRNTPLGFSLQRTIGATTWAVPRPSTKGRANTVRLDILQITH